MKAADLALWALVVVAMALFSLAYFPSLRDAAPLPHAAGGAAR